MTKGGSAWFRPTVRHALHIPKSKMVATVCRLPMPKAEMMIRGILTHPVLTRLLLGQHRNATIDTHLLVKP